MSTMNRNLFDAVKKLAFKTSVDQLKKKGVQQVNVVGLEFENSKTMTTFRGGKPVMIITSRIRSVAGTTVGVPPVLVSLLDGSGATVYEWTVTPLAAQMSPGEILDFSTEVNAPPQGATTVRLSFANPRAGAAAASAGTL